MRKNIKNYTTSIAVEKTMMEIQKLLVKNGAEKIMIDYESGEPVGLMFLLKAGDKMLPIKLPARFKNVGVIMFPPRYDWKKTKWSDLTDSQQQQAKRTAWRNIKDWIDAQLALIETEMVKIEEVFLPYVLTGNQTLYERFESGSLQLGSGQHD